MLQKIHEKVHGLIAWVLIVFIAITFVLWGINYYIDAHNHTQNAAVASVNGTVIYNDAFKVAYERLKREEQNRPGANLAPTTALEQQLKQRALKQLILNQVVLQSAKNAGFKTSKGQAEAALTQYPQFQENGRFSQEKFRQVLSANLFTPDSFLQEIEASILVNQQHFAFAGTAFVLPNEVDAFIRLYNQTRDYSFLVIDANKFKEKVVISDDELRQYYEKNKNNFKTPEQVSIQYLQLSLAQISSQLKFSEQELQTYYNENSDNYTKPAKYELAHILIKLPAAATASQIAEANQKAKEVISQFKQGKKFPELAAKYSEDILSAKKGGVMPPITLGTFEPSFDKAMIELRTPGQISKPIKTKNGFEILNLISYSAPEQMPFAQVKEQITKSLQADKAQQIFAQDSDDLNNITYQNPDSLEQAAKQLNLTIQESELFTRKGATAGIAQNKKVVHAAFSNEVLNEKNNSQLITLDDDSLAVIRIKTHKPQEIIPFAQMQDKIKQIILTEKSQQLAKSFGEQLVKDLQDNKPITEQLSQAKISWQEAVKVKRDTENNLNSVTQFAFNLPRPQPGKPLPMAGISQANGNYLIVKLNQVNAGTASSITKKQRESYASEMASALGLEDYNLHIQALMSQAKVKENRSPSPSLK